MVKKSKSISKTVWTKLVVVIQGVQSLLINNPEKLRDSRTPDEAQEEAELRLYNNGDGRPVLPLKIIYATLKEAGRKVTISFNGKNQKVTGSRGSLLYGLIRIKGAYVKINPGDWVVDTQLTRNPATGGMNWTSRPRFDNWGCEIELEYNKQLIAEEKVRELFEVAGLWCGVGDNRPNSPNNPGQHGQFEVVEVR